MGFKEVRIRLIAALQSGAYLHEARGQIDTKNLLQRGLISTEQVLEVVKRCNGTHYESSPHHVVKGVDVHILKRDGLYIKFYFIDPNVFFISVHR